MSISDLRLKSAQHDVDGSSLDTPFRRRVLIQQFLNDLSPVLSALSSKRQSPTDPASLLERIEELSRAIAESAGEDPKLMARSYRPLAAQVISMEIGAFNGTEGQGILVGYLDLLRSYQSLTGTERAPYPEYSGEASVFLTGANVASRLATAVMTYSFRQDPAKVLKRLTASVLDVAVKVPVMMAAEPVDARQSLMQTLSNRAAELMAASYNRVAHETVLVLQDCSEAEIIEYLGREDRVSLVIAEFEKWASLWFSSASTYAAGVLEAARSHTDCPQP